jgi:outer membrane protein TolC
VTCVTLTVGNAYLQIIGAKSRIEAQEAQVRNAQALYDQAIDAYQAGSSPIALSGNYSDVGTTFAHSHGTLNFQAGVSVPIFAGGTIR